MRLFSVRMDIVDLSSARAQIKAMKRATSNSMEDFELDESYKKTRTSWLKGYIKIIDAMYGRFNLLIERKDYVSTKNRTNTRIYFSIADDNTAGLIKVILNTKKMTVGHFEMRGYVSEHAFERVVCSGYILASHDFLEAYCDLLKELIKPSWVHKGGLNIYTKHGVLCAIKDLDVDDVPMFVIKTFIKSKSFDLGSNHERLHQKVLDTGENQFEFVRSPKH